MAHHNHNHRHHHQRRDSSDSGDFWAQLANDAADAFGVPGVFQDDPQQSTIVSVVYVTKSATGSVIGWRTMTSPIGTGTPTPSTTPEPTTSTTLVADTSSQKHTTTKAPKETSTGLPKSIDPPSTTVDNNGLLVATNSQNQPSSTLSATNSATNTAVAKSSGGMSVGGQAGLAIGVICLVGAIASIIFFCFKKRRDAKRDKLDDEKQEVWGGAERQASTRTMTNAPRLSLRPVTQFLPNLGESRQSRGNTLAMANAAPAPGTRRPMSWEAPMSQQDGNRHNPFGNHAEQIDTANANGPPVVEVVSPQGEIVAAGAVGAAAGAVVGLTRGASKRENGLQKDFTTKNPMLPPVSPVGTEFSMSSEPSGPPAQTPGGAAIAAAGGPANSTVHRVQLDFKPSMDDELELRAGQLIRLLHEYDDGWALCIRLDRSAQGVVPRTCLSVRPVKPRPQQNGPRGPPPGMRGPPGQPRPMSPGMNGPGPMNQGRMSPAMNGRMSPSQGRPASPSQRPMGANGPNGQGRPRSPSASQMQERRNSPPGPSPMNPAANGPQTSPQNGPVGRKPVPGQAM
ncbi:hypothetical protein OIDMADRAFT_23307 [Oidiodendron maius Zn]|uniref:SH3 domain-containing protein n=1 Tax=Oidiodendron maius (strain Zn) TaxID=913774 RepID=A0A0C3E2H5_OIDMZ|nr:hypothetical protein OIDMADRAFT_23307 [Oidiodendron maius Zn]